MSCIRRERFERVASKRVERVIKDIKMLGNCSNINNYEYSNIDIDKMLKAIREEIKLLDSTFRSGIKDLDEGFKF